MMPTGCKTGAPPRNLLALTFSQAPFWVTRVLGATIGVSLGSWQTEFTKAALSRLLEAHDIINKLPRPHNK